MATNFLAATGTNGFLATPVTAFSTGTTTINSIANAATVVSTLIFSQTNTSQGLYGYANLTIGSTFNPTAGANIAGWWLYSSDGGTTFESTLTVRPPDFIIPLTTSTSTGAGINSPSNGAGLYTSQLVPMPWTSFKVLVQNNTGVTLGSSGQVLSFATVAVQY